MDKRFLALILVLMISLSLIACGGGSEGQEPAGDDPQQEQEVGDDTPDEPEKEPEKQLDPIVFTGSGDDVLDIGSIEDGYVFHITGNSGNNHFAVSAYDASGNSLALLVNTVSAYDGITLEDSLSATMLEISATGDWTVELMPFSMLPRYKMGDTATGTGDTVFLTDGASRTADIAGNKSSAYFSVLTYSTSSRDLAVNTVDPYEGTVMLHDNPSLFAVSAEDSWSIKLN